MAIVGAGGVVRAASNVSASMSARSNGGMTVAKNFPTGMSKHRWRRPEYENLRDETAGMRYSAPRAFVSV